MMEHYWPEFLALYVLNLINLISPGVGCLLTARNSMAYSRKSGISTALGIVSSSFIHKAYVFIIFSFLISQYSTLFLAVKYLGCAYLIYLGANCLRHSFKNSSSTTFDLEPNEASKNNISSGKAFRMGFFVDLLNPMASVTFLGIVAATVSSNTPGSILTIYFISLITTSLCWYILIAVFFSKNVFQILFVRFQNWIERVQGGMLLWFGFKLIF